MRGRIAPAMARNEFKLEGLKELDQALAELGKRTGAAVTQRVLDKVGAPIRDTMKDLAPVDDGVTRDSVRMIRAASERSRQGKAAFAQTMKSTGGDVAQARGALRTTMRGLKAGSAMAGVIIGPGRAPQAFFAEFGTGERFHKNGKSVGSMPAQPYIRPAWDSHKDGLIDEIARLMAPEIEKAAKRQANKAARLKTKVG